MLYGAVGGVAAWVPAHAEPGHAASAAAAARQKNQRASFGGRYAWRWDVWFDRISILFAPPVGNVPLAFADGGDLYPRWVQSCRSASHARE
ncbi:hypothetical protein GCM10025857_23060 [Alicyclobacillus contaminans]|nr:hypothetical protein GCM10025857_23060 [Alicyclobacillus contaminans]